MKRLLVHPQVVRNMAGHWWCILRVTVPVCPQLRGSWDMGLLSFKRKAPDKPEWGGHRNYRGKTKQEAKGHPITQNYCLERKGQRKDLLMIKIFWNEIVVITAQFCEYTKNHYIVHFKREVFRVHELHLHKHEQADSEPIPGCHQREMGQVEKEPVTQFFSASYR